MKQMNVAKNILIIIPVIFGRRGGAFKIRSPDFRQKKFGFRSANTTKMVWGQVAQTGVRFSPSPPRQTRLAFESGRRV